MAERTLDEIASTTTVTTNGAHSQTGAIADVTEHFVRFISTHGPYKTETLAFQLANGDDFKADDTIKSILAHPLFATIVPAADLSNTAFIGSVEVNSLESNSNFKTITLRDAEDINSIGIVITVYGY